MCFHTGIQQKNSRSINSGGNFYYCIEAIFFAFSSILGAAVYVLRAFLCSLISLLFHACYFEMGLILRAFLCSLISLLFHACHLACAKHKVAFSCAQAHFALIISLLLLRAFFLEISQIQRAGKVSYVCLLNENKAFSENTNSSVLGRANNTPL